MTHYSTIGLRIESPRSAGTCHSARAIVTLAEALTSYDSMVERVVTDTSGNELPVISGARGHSVRMNLESQNYYAPQ